MKVPAIAAAIALLTQAPVPSPIPGTHLLETTTVDGPLEVRSANAEAEAVLAGHSYTRQRYGAGLANAESKSPASLAKQLTRRTPRRRP